MISRKIGRNEVCPTSNKKYNSDQVKIILKLQNIPNMSMAKACRKLDQDYNIKISNQTLNSIESKTPLVDLLVEKASTLI